MRFCVSVPVLSLQMTVVEPSASTAGRWRTRALRFAMRCVAIASDSVTVGSRPSGTLATMMPMANSRFSQRRQAQRLADEEEHARRCRWRQGRDDARQARDLALQRRARLRPRSASDARSCRTRCACRSRTPARAPGPTPAACRRAGCSSRSSGDVLGAGLGVARLGQRFAGDRGGVHAQAERFDQAAVGGNEIAFLQQDDVARHQLRGRGSPRFLRRAAPAPSAAAAGAAPPPRARPCIPARRKTRR